MNFSLLACEQFKISEGNSFLISKTNTINNKEENQKKELLMTSSNGNDNSTNNLEIIDYPYPSNIEKDVSLINNTSEINYKVDENEEIINNESYMRLHELVEEKLNRKNSLNSSSDVINNEDSIIQNKKILQNLYSSRNNNNQKIIKNIKFDNSKNIYINKTNVKIKNSKNKIVNKKKNHYTFELKVNKFHHSSNKFSFAKHLFEKKIIKRKKQKYVNEKKIKSKSKSKNINNIKKNIQKNNNSKNQIHILNTENTSNIIKKNRKLINVLYFKSFSKQIKLLNSSLNSSKNKNKKSLQKKILFKKRIEGIEIKKMKKLNNKTIIESNRTNKKIGNVPKLKNNETNTSMKNRKTNSTIYSSYIGLSLSLNLQNDNSKHFSNRINCIRNHYKQNKKKKNFISTSLNKSLSKQINKKSNFKLYNEQKNIYHTRKNTNFNPFEGEIKIINNSSAMKHNKNISEL